MTQGKSKKGSDFLYVGIGQIAATLLGTAFWLILVFVLHPAAYGYLAWLISIATLVSTVTVFGLGKTIATYYPKENNDLLISSSVFLVLITSLCGGTITVLLLNYWIESAFPGIIAALIVALSVFALTFYSELGKQGYKKYMWLWIGVRTASLILPLILYYIFETLTAILCGITAAYFIFGSWVLRNLKNGINFAVIQKKIDFSTKAWIANIGKVSINFLDKILIGALFPGMVVLGVYQFSYRIFTLLAVLPNTLFFYLLPEKSHGKETRKTETIGFLTSLLLALLILWLAPRITSHVFPQFPEGINTVRIMGLAVIPATLVRIKASEKFSNEEAGIVLSSRLFGLAIGIIGILFSFYKGLGLIGLAISMLFIQIGLLIGLVVFPKIIKVGSLGKILLYFIAIIITSCILLLSLNIIRPQVSVEGGYLFTIEQPSEEIIEGFEQGYLKKEIIDVFIANNKEISEDATLSKIDVDKWEIKDRDNYFKISKNNGRLDFYRKNKVEKVDPLVMDTVAKIEVYTYNEEEGKKAIAEAFQEIYRIEELMDAESKGSEVYELNNAGTEWVQMSPETIYVLEKSKKYGQLTNNSFDITAKPLVDFWLKEVKEKGVVPETPKLKKYIDLVDLNRLNIDTKKSKARLEKEDMEITLGGIAKGYAVDRAIQVLEKNNIETGMVNIGGDIRVMGSRHWNIGIADPREVGKNIETIQLQNAAVSTSGDYRRYHLIGEERVHHIINPKTGKPASSCISVTVIDETSLGADALSTGVFVSGPKKGKHLIDSINAKGLFIDDQGNIIKTDLWDSEF